LNKKLRIDIILSGCLVKIRLTDGISQGLPCLDLKWNAVLILIQVILIKKKIIPWNAKTQPVILKINSEKYC